MSTLEGLRFKNGNDHLRVSEYKRLSSFLLFLAKKPSKARILFRGVTLDHLNSKFKTTTIEEIPDYLFMLGEKAKAIWQPKRSQFKIQDLTDTFFKYIFTQYRDLLQSNDGVALAFKKANKQFSSFFSKENERLFLQRLQHATQQEKMEIRDYLLVPLHHAAKITKSLLLSTTTSLSVAHHFGNDEIVIVGWMMPSRKLAIGKDPTNKKYKIPRYTTSFYPDEKELTIKAGLLPHNILGFIDVKKKNFIVNPSLLSDDRPLTEIVSLGINVDQTDFHEVRRKTNIQSFFLKTPDDKYFSF